MTPKPLRKMKFRFGHLEYIIALNFDILNLHHQGLKEKFHVHKELIKLKKSYLISLLIKKTLLLIVEHQ